MIPKAELHVHLEGAIPPHLIRTFAKRNGFAIDETIFRDENNFSWHDFTAFIDVYRRASEVLKTPEDYRDAIYQYLKQSAAEGAIYVETMPSPDHAAAAGLSYVSMMEEIDDGIKEKKKEFNIECRVMITGVRHYGKESCEQVAALALKYPHPLVVGYAIGGDELGFPPKQFAKAYHMAREAGLGCMCHAGEWSGPEGIWEAIDHLPLQRIGHGVRAIEDPQLVQEIIQRDLTLEISPGSNIALGVYPNYALHSFMKLRQAGVKVTLNSDDPPYFNTTLGREYDNAKREFNLTDAELIEITRTAISNSFADELTKQGLEQRLNNVNS